jgi:GT2 family glycosyltransferase
MKLAVLLTSFNRCAKTLGCLGALKACAAQAQQALSIYLVDDASTDGTAEQVRRLHPEVRLLPGGDLYWCRGMHRAFAAALADGHDAYLWLNDDTELQSHALSQLLRCLAQLQHTHGRGQIVVGSTVDPANQRLSYGGERQASRWRPLTLSLIAPTEQPQRIDCMNGNIVLIDAAAAAKVGNLDPRFAHAMGDTDYGLRAKRLGVGLWLAPGVHGHCVLNPVQGTFHDRRLSLRQRWQLMHSRKGLPWRSWLQLTKRHTGWAWPVFFVWPYARLLVSSLRGRAPHGRSV